MTREKQNEDKNQRNSEVTQERILNQKANTTTVKTIPARS